MKMRNLSRLANDYRSTSEEGAYVLYWMQAAQRFYYNPALEAAALTAANRNLPLLVVFCVDQDVPEANLRHYTFMLQGLEELANELNSKGIAIHICQGSALEVLPYYLRECIALFCDRGYLNWQKEMRLQLRGWCHSLEKSYYEIDTEAVVPVHLASTKEEYSAATLRTKILKLLPLYLEREDPETYLKDLPRFQNQPLLHPGRPCFVPKKGNPHFLIQDLLPSLKVDRCVPPSQFYYGGRKEALRLLQEFLKHRYPSYAYRRSDPGLNLQAELSPYLHFGQISPVELVLAAQEYTNIPLDSLSDLIKTKDGLEMWDANLAAFCEELIVRRELGFNFCQYNPDYDQYSALPQWAERTLEEHSPDPRPTLYSIAELEAAKTHDTYWNAAQKELLITGKMHSYMRMYWGKKVLEWSPDPQSAFYHLIYLNNRYSLDGRDPCSFAGIAWCFGKHDRPWQEREIFGSVRYMNSAGLERKFDMQAYLRRIEGLN